MHGVWFKLFECVDFKQVETCSFSTSNGSRRHFMHLFSIMCHDTWHEKSYFGPQFLIDSHYELYFIYTFKNLVGLNFYFNNNLAPQQSKFVIIKKVYCSSGIISPNNFVYFIGSIDHATLTKLGSICHLIIEEALFMRPEQKEALLLLFFFLSPIVLLHILILTKEKKNIKLDIPMLMSQDSIISLFNFSPLSCCQ